LDLVWLRISLLTRPVVGKEKKSPGINLSRFSNLKYNGPVNI
jgi:hypothetical protein